MKQKWKECLEGAGAEFEGNRLVSFGNPERERRIPPQGDVICDLTHIGLISVSGEDAADFLHNQLTNDIYEVTESRAQRSAWCNPKGRVLATFIIHKHGDTYYLSLSADLLDFVMKRLKMYILRSKVVMKDVTESVVHFGMCGSHIEKDWDLCCDGELPQEDYGVTNANGLTIMRIPAVVPRYEVFGDVEPAIKLWQKLSVRAAPVSGSASWIYLNIRNGIPVVTAASSEAWIPQMLNFIQVGGVSFKKGCYPGQEVVARLKYLGKTKRRLYRLTGKTSEIPAGGDGIISAEDNEEAGKVLNAVQNPDGVLEMLAVLKIDMAGKPLKMGAGNAPLTILDLPYEVEE